MLTLAVAVPNIIAKKFLELLGIEVVEWSDVRTPVGHVFLLKAQEFIK